LTSKGHPILLKSIRGIKKGFVARRLAKKYPTVSKKKGITKWTRKAWEGKRCVEAKMDAPWISAGGAQKITADHEHET